MPRFEVCAYITIEASDEITAADIVRQRILEDDAYPVISIDIDASEIVEV